MNYDELEISVPIGDAGNYFVSVFGTKQKSASAVKSFIRSYVGMPGLFVWHDSGGMTKTGTWTSSGNVNSMYATYRYSVEAGATMYCTVTGSVIGIQIFQSTNGGYAIVGIDGDYTAAELLPAFTNQDYVDGKCRLTDIGKRYFDCYSGLGWTTKLPITKNASSGTHTVTIEVTGTKRSSSSDYRCYMEGIVGVTGGAVPPSASVHMLPLYSVVGNQSGWSAQCWVCSWAPVGSTDYQFIGENHADNINSKETETSWSITVDTTDQTAIARGSYASGTNISISHVTDVYHKSNLSASVATKTRNYTFMANRKFPIMVDLRILWNIAGGIAYEYPVMITTPDITKPITGFLPDYFNRAYAGGNKVTITKNYNETTTTVYGNGRTLIVAGDEVAYFAELLYANPPDVGIRKSFTHSYVDRSSQDFKMYYVKTTLTGGTSPYSVGETTHYIMGWGAMINPKGYL